MNSIQNQVFRSRDRAVSVLSMMSSEALKSMAIDIRSQVNAGLMSDGEGHEKINLISGVLMSRECTDLISRECTDSL
jgi:hypothetical protein